MNSCNAGDNESNKLFMSINTKLVIRLRKMVREDQKAVKKRQKSGEANIPLLKKNAEEMKKIVRNYGWPTVSLVGKEGARNAWLLVQHADLDTAFQRKCLRLMLSARKKKSKEVALMHIAFLTDRILVNQKKPQKFGTQFYTNKKREFTYWPIRDIRNVDKRRALYGIEPLAEYIKAAKSYKLIPLKK